MARALRINPSDHSYCCYCKRGPLIQGRKGARGSGMTATRDHINPLANGGGRWVLCCQTCNGLKGSLRPTAWWTFIDANPSYWRSFPTHAHVVRWLIDHNVDRRRQGQRGIAIDLSVPGDFLVALNRV